MKESRFNLVSSVLALVLGAVLSFIITNLFLGAPEDVTFKTIESVVTKSTGDPDPEVFNSRAIDPTVEIYIGGDEE